MPKLSVNVDHVATVRQARGGKSPDPVAAALLAELAGADGIIVHLREDRRHIQDRDVEVLRGTVKTRLNLEMANTEEILRIALRVKPDMATFVPERRQELTTEGGLDVHGNAASLAKTLGRLKEAGILFQPLYRCRARPGGGEQAGGCGFRRDPHREIQRCPVRKSPRRNEFQRIVRAIQLARRLGLRVNIGHGLDYQNVVPFTRVPEIEEYSIGHSIIARAVLVGLDRAVREMKDLIMRKES